MRHVNASRKKMGLPLVMRAAWLRECCGYACLSGVAYDDKTGCTARRRSKGSNALDFPHENAKLCVIPHGKCI